MKHCCVEDPSDLCSVNISGKEITEVKEEDLALFDNVAYVNASENFLPFGKHAKGKNILGRSIFLIQNEFFYKVYSSIPTIKLFCLKHEK